MNAIRKFVEKNMRAVNGTLTTVTLVIELAAAGCNLYKSFNEAKKVYIDGKQYKVVNAEHDIIEAVEVEG